VRGARAGRLVVAVDADAAVSPGHRGVADRLRGSRRARAGRAGRPPPAPGLVQLRPPRRAAAHRAGPVPGPVRVSSAAGVIYLAFLVMMLVTGGVALARARSRPGVPVP